MKYTLPHDKERGLQNVDMVSMTIKHFKELSEIQQVRILIEYGVLLSDRIEGDNKLFLYAVYSFYVELFHEVSNFQTEGLRILRCFDEVEHLEAYLSNIEMPDFC